jgi:hypothetical protein
MLDYRIHTRMLKRWQRMLNGGMLKGSKVLKVILSSWSGF